MYIFTYLYVCIFMAVGLCVYVHMHPHTRTGSHSVIPDLTLSAWPVNLLDMQTLGLHPRPPESETPGMGQAVFEEALQRIRVQLKFESHCSKITLVGGGGGGWGVRQKWFPAGLEKSKSNAWGSSVQVQDTDPPLPPHTAHCLD